MDWQSLLDRWVDDVGKKAGRNFFASLAPDKRVLAMDTMKDLALLRATEAAGTPVPERELKLCESTLGDLAVGISKTFQRSLLEVLKDSADMAGSAILGLVETVLRKIS